MFAQEHIQRKSSIQSQISSETFDKEDIVMEEKIESMAQCEPCLEGSIFETADFKVNVKEEPELIIEDYGTYSNAEDGQYYDTESESSYNFGREPEEKRAYIEPPDKDVKKKAFIKRSTYIYGKYVMIQCPLCDYEFDSSLCWKKHIRLMHHLEKPENLDFIYNDAGAKCKLCDFQVATPRFNLLLDHHLSHMSFSHFICKLCSWRTKTHSSMNLHLRQQHAEKLEGTTKSLEVTVCPYCQQKFASLWYLRKHMLHVHEKTIDERTCFICLDCGENFLTNVSLRAHVFEKFAGKTVAELGFKEAPGTGDDETKIICTQCPTVFAKITSNQTLINVREHYMLHLGEPSGKHAYKCKYCDESFRRFHSIRFHVCEELRKVLQTSSVGNEPMSKAECKARLPSRKRKNAKKNEPVEFNVDYMKKFSYIQYVCLKCGISFGKTKHCKRHMFQTHGMDKPEGLDFKKLGNQGESDLYECTLCEGFTCDFDLNRMLVHARIHTVYDPFQCKFCHTSFVYESEIPRHECIDAEKVKSLIEFTYPKDSSIPNMESFCPKCERTYGRLSTLYRHMNEVHCMNEPYGLGFEPCQSNDAEDKIYRCNECENFKTTEKNLRAMLEHARQHFPFESFRCTICKERFRLKERARHHQCTNDTIEVDDKFEEGVKKIRLNKMGRICPKCGKKFKRSCACKYHLNKSHGMDKPDGLGFEKVKWNDDVTKKIEAYRCMDCPSYIIPKLDLSLMLEHAREHFPLDSFWCMLCHERFRLKVQAKAHKCLNPSIRHPGEDDNGVENDYTSHTRYPKTFEKYIRKFCPECNTEISSMKIWRWHLRRYHEMHTLSGLHMKPTNGNLVECLICQVQTTHARRQEHRFIHLPFKPFQCIYCSEYFTEIEKAKSHCNECAQAPVELPGGEEPKKEAATPRKRAPYDVNEKKETNQNSSKINVNEEIFNKSHKQPNKRESLVKLVVPTDSDSSESESENATTNKGICVVLADDSDFAKFVRISCPFCPDTEFESNRMLSHHFYDAHDSFREHFTIHKTNAANCKSCNKYFNVVYKKTMIKHYLSDISATSFCCRLCDKKAIFFGAMRSHLLIDHQAVIAGQTQEQSSSTATTADPLNVASVDISKVSRTTMAIPTSKTAVFNEFNAYISYACPECNTPFESSEQWHLHINGEHDFFDQHQLNIEATPDGFKRCRQCSVNINGSVLAEQRHKLTHMQYKSFICTLCQHRSTTLGVLTQHFRRRHFAKGTFACRLCPIVLSTSCEQIEHMKNEHDPSEYPPKLCRVCFSMFGSPHALRLHMELHNPNREVIPCDLCDRNYMNKRELIAHVRAKHPGQEPTTSLMN